MPDHETPGDRLSTRLASRSGLHRASMDDGGEVYKGPLARRALRALRARAFTVDETIIVDDDFDTEAPEDQALYAHERVHQTHSGGDDHPSSLMDAEEVAARAVETMVLHRRAAGESFGAIMRDVDSGVTEVGTSAPPSGAVKKPAGAQGALSALLAGKSYDQVVRDLTQYCVRAMTDENDSGFRSRGLPQQQVLGTIGVAAANAGSSGSGGGGGGGGGGSEPSAPVDEEPIVETPAGPTPEDFAEAVQEAHQAALDAIAEVLATLPFPIDPSFLPPGVQEALEDEKWSGWAGGTPPVANEYVHPDRPDAMVGVILPDGTKIPIAPMDTDNIESYADLGSAIKKGIDFVTDLVDGDDDEE